MDVPHGPLDLALGLGAVRTTRPDTEAPLRGETQEYGIRGGFAAARPLIRDDDGLELVEQELVWHAAERAVRGLDPVISTCIVWRRANYAPRNRESPNTTSSA